MGGQGMSGPERIWAEQTDTADQNWRTHDRFGGIEYHRADITETRIAAAVKAALREAAGVCMTQKTACVSPQREPWERGNDSAVSACTKAIRALADDPAFMARIVKGSGNG
jgi:hypothetical protein